MPCGSPCGIFTTLTVEELAAVKAGAIAAMTSGQWTTVTGGQKTGSKEYQDPAMILREVKYAEQKLGLIPGRVSRTTSDFVRVPYPATVPNENVS